MPSTIKLKHGSGAPSASDIVQGEPALDLTNKRLYSEDGSANVLEIGTNPTELTVDDVAINGKIITMTGSASDTATITAGTNGTLDIVTTDAAAAAANIQITADGTAELAGTTVTLDSSGGITLDADGGTITFADAGSSLGTITSSGYSGNAASATTATTASSVDVASLSEIATVANDDVFIAVDTSGGGLKKIARSAVVAGLATSSAISNVVDDTTPQLGGDLDMNGQDIVTTSNADLELAPNGTGHVTVKGNTNAGSIQFNCESNSHGQIVKSQPHSAAVTNTMLLPAGSSSTLVSLVSTDTLTNKTLTSPKINEDVAVTSTATELNILDGVTSTTAELNKLDGVTATTAELNYLDITTLGTSAASKAVTADANGDVLVSQEFRAVSYNETYVAPTSSSNATTIACESGNYFKHTLTENTTFTFSNPPSSGTGYSFILHLIQDSSARTVTWPGAVDWAGGSAPTISTGNGDDDFYVFATSDGGTIWYGFTAGQAMA